nr:HNH endonuclease family protein [Sphingomonas oleivorans]
MGGRTADLDRWPDDTEWRHHWIMREQYRNARQPRLRYIFEAIESAKQTPLNENIVIRSALTIEHIMPQKWHATWPLPGMEGVSEADYPPELANLVRARNSAVNAIGNLTLMTLALNLTISNGPFSVKMPAIKANTALALSRDLGGFDYWDEAAIQDRGDALFEVARTIWGAPDRTDIPVAATAGTPGWSALPTFFPAKGTQCRFVYAGKEFRGVITEDGLSIDGSEMPHKSFSAASRALTGISPTDGDGLLQSLVGRSMGVAQGLAWLGPDGRSPTSENPQPSATGTTILIGVENAQGNLRAGQ